MRVVQMNSFSVANEIGENTKGAMAAFGLADMLFLISMESHVDCQLTRPKELSLANITAKLLS